MTGKLNRTCLISPEPPSFRFARFTEAPTAVACGCRTRGWLPTAVGVGAGPYHYAGRSRSRLVAECEARKRPVMAWIRAAALIPSQPFPPVPNQRKIELKVATGTLVGLVSPLPGSE